MDLFVESEAMFLSVWSLGQQYLRHPGISGLPQEPRVPLDPDAAPGPPRALGPLRALRIPGLGQPGCAPW